MNKANRKISKLLCHRAVEIILENDPLKNKIASLQTFLLSQPNQSVNLYTGQSENLEIMFNVNPVS